MKTQTVNIVCLKLIDFWRQVNSRWPPEIQSAAKISITQSIILILINNHWMHIYELDSKIVETLNKL